LQRTDRDSEAKFGRVKPTFQSAKPRFHHESVLRAQCPVPKANHRRGTVTPTRRSLRPVSSLNKFNGNESPLLDRDDHFRKHYRTGSIVPWVESLRLRSYPVRSRGKLHLKLTSCITRDKSRFVIQRLVGFDGCDRKLDTGESSSRWSSRYATDHNGVNSTFDTRAPISGCLQWIWCWCGHTPRVHRDEDER